MRTRSPWGCYWRPDCLIPSLHIIPVDDVQWHQWVNCECGPAVTVEPGAAGFVFFKVSHNAYDGRP